jgi:excisionase family DNA binding protein
VKEKMLMSVREAAQALGIGRDTAYGLIRDGRLPAVRVGRRVLVPRTALERWIEAETGRMSPGGGLDAA